MVDVRVNEVATSIRVRDPDAMLSDAMVQRIVEAVLAAQEAREAEDRRRDADRSLDGPLARVP